MIKTLTIAIFLTIFITACVAPAPYGPYGNSYGPAYVGPTYVSPGAGYYWRYHSNYGWGWHHPANGWHRGWR